jgi:hypothetical protein
MRFRVRHGDKTCDCSGVQALGGWSRSEERRLSWFSARRLGRNKGHLRMRYTTHTAWDCPAKYSIWIGSEHREFIESFGVVTLRGGI